MDTLIKILPFDEELESKVVLKKLARAHKALAELKGAGNSLPNEGIFINTLSLQEAKDSSAIENIITTHDELYQSDFSAARFASAGAKEVYNYSRALQHGFVAVRANTFLTNKLILEIQAIIEENKAGFRKLPGTVLKNDLTGETVYEPPQHPEEIISLMSNLEKFINDSELCDWDPLVKMAVIHHQFESIHPFYDGNGRTGRIINILYLVKEDLLRLPILYLSRFINANKSDYYQLLQEVRITQNWEAWLLFILDGVEKTSSQALILLEGIKAEMARFKAIMKQDLPKIYSQDLLNNLFRHPYTKIELVSRELNVSRQTSAKYLDELARIELVRKHRIGKESYYVNEALYELLTQVSQRYPLNNR